MEIRPIVASKNSLQLPIGATLAELPTHRFQVEASALGREIQKEFQDRPELPGVSIVEGDRVIGIISRQKFLQQMSQPYSLELYLRRPASMLSAVVEADTLYLPSTCTIERAVRQALKRPENLRYEPIVVCMDGDDRDPHLLEFGVLLLAQSQIFARVGKRLRTEKERARKYALNLQREQARAREYATQLQVERIAIRQRNRTLELQQGRLAEQAQAMAADNARCLRIGHLLSQTGKRTVTEMLKGADTIATRTEQIDAVGRALQGELATLREATETIARAGQQVRYLTMQATLATHRAREEGESDRAVAFGKIASEIASLECKTYAATGQIDRVASRLGRQIRELLAAAAESSSVAQTLGKSSQQTRATLQELESLMLGQDCPESVLADAVIAGTEIAAIG